MDKQLTAALSHVSSISESLSALQTASLSASQCAHSARSLLPHSGALCARRMQRSEALLTLFRTSQVELSASLSSFRAALDGVASQTPRVKARWDRLSDTWWATCAQRTAGLVDTVQESVERLERRMDVDGEGYAEAVDAVVESTHEVTNAWEKVLKYVEEWEPIANAVLEGLGEEGSLIPT